MFWVLFVTSLLASGYSAGGKFKLILKTATVYKLTHKLDVCISFFNVLPFVLKIKQSNQDD